jgi:DNA-binding HxlR family transcriptional regulator
MRTTPNYREVLDAMGDGYLTGAQVVALLPHLAPEVVSKRLQRLAKKGLVRRELTVHEGKTARWRRVRA